MELLFVLALALGGLIYWYQKHEAKRKADLDRSFQEAFILMATVLPPASSHIHRQWVRIAYPGATRLRTAELIFDSLRIAQRSPNKSTAESRIEMAEAEWHAHGFPLRNVLDAQIADELQALYETALCSAHNGTVIAQIIKELKRHKDLKTQRGKDAAVARMTEIAASAARNPRVNMNAVREVLGDLGVVIEIEYNTAPPPPENM